MNALGYMKTAKVTLFAFAVFCILPVYGIAQVVSNDTTSIHELPIGVTLFEGDSIPVYMLGEVSIIEKIIFKSEKEQFKYTKLVRDIKKTLPYARLCRTQITEIERTLNGLQGEQERAQYIKRAEKDLFNQFEKPLKGLTFTQGRLLIKLIDRETGDTSYNLIKDLKGGFSAFVWQSVARMFGSNLKSEYDAGGEDSKIESIIYLIDMGVY